MLDQSTANRVDYLILAKEIEDFLYGEADLLDERRYEDWLNLFAEEIRYWMPMRKNLAFSDRDRDITQQDDVAWIDDDKLTLTKRVQQIMTGVHWAEEPMSRVSRLISNIRMEEPRSRLEEGETALVKCHFLVHRSRLQDESDMIAGRRSDMLRRVGDSFQFVERKIIIDQSVLMAKNLSFFL